LAFIVVEEKHDEQFIKNMLSYLEIDYTKYEFIRLGSKNNLKHYDTEREKANIKNENFLIIMDRDRYTDKGNESTEKIIKDFYKSDTIPDTVFLMPNNEDEGNLETVLKNIAKYQKPIDCFDSYVSCVNSIEHVKYNDSDKKLNVPDPSKSRIFAYEELFYDKRNMYDASIFDYNHQYLTQLRDFFIMHLKNTL